MIATQTKASMTLTRHLTESLQPPAKWRELDLLTHLDLSIAATKILDKKKPSVAQDAAHETTPALANIDYYAGMSTEVVC